MQSWLASNSSSCLSLASLSFCSIRVRLSRQEGNTACITFIAQKFYRKLIYVMTGNYGKLLVGPSCNGLRGVLSKELCRKDESLDQNYSAVSVRHANDSHRWSVRRHPRNTVNCRLGRLASPTRRNAEE